MEREGIDIYDRIFAFIVSTLKTTRLIPKTQECYIIKKQLIRSVTSIGANANEADACSSKRDFINKLTIAKKEANETLYWMRLLNCLYSNVKLDRYIKECSEIVRILSVIIYRTRKVSR